MWWVNCLKDHKKLSICPLGFTPFAPSVTGITLMGPGGDHYDGMLFQSSMNFESCLTNPSRAVSSLDEALVRLGVAMKQEQDVLESMEKMVAGRTRIVALLQICIKRELKRLIREDAGEPQFTAESLSRMRVDGDEDGIEGSGNVGDGQDAKMAEPRRPVPVI